MNIICIAIVVFCSQASLYLNTFGAITELAFSFSGFDSTSVVVGLGALGAGVGLMMKVERLPSVLALLLLGSLSSVGILLIGRFSVPWYIAFCIHQFAFFKITAKVMASVASLDANYIEKNNKKIQITNVFATLLGVTLAPLLLSWHGPEVIFQISLFFSLIASSILIFSWKNQNVGQSVQDTVSGRQFQYVFLNNKWILSLVYLVFLVGGFFHIIEVPILVDRFKYSEDQVAMVFFLTVASSLSAMTLVKSTFLSKQLKQLITLSSVILATLSAAYAVNYSQFAVPILICLFGASNGIFNLAYTTKISNIKSQANRETAFLMSRGLAQLGLLTSSILCGFFSQQIIPSLVYGSALLLLALLFIKSKVARLAAGSLVASVFIFGPDLLWAINNLKTKPIVMQVGSLPKKIDPSSIYDSASALIHSQVFDGLYRLDESNFVVPVLVKRQIWSKDQKHLELWLDTSVRFSDGTRLTAAHVIESFTRTISASGESLKWALGDVVGFEDFVSGKTKTLRGISSPETGKIELRLRGTSPNLTRVLAAPYFKVAKRAAEESVFVGTGQYKIKSRDKQNICITKNKFNKKARDIVESICFVSPGSGIQAEEVDISIVPPNGLSNQLGEVKFPYSQAVILIFNTSRVSLKDPATRCGIGGAVSQSFDRSKYNWNPTFMGLPFSWSILELDEMGVTNRESIGKKLEIIHSDSAAFFDTQTNQEIKQKLSKQGLHVKFVPMGIHDLVKKVKSKSFEAALIGYVPDYAHPDAILSPLLGTGQAYNFSHYNDRELDKLLMSARNAPDYIKQTVYYKKAFQVIKKNCPVVFLGNQPGVLYTRKGVRVPKFSSLGYHYLDLSKVSLKQEDNK